MMREIKNKNKEKVLKSEHFRDVVRKMRIFIFFISLADCGLR